MKKVLSALGWTWFVISAMFALHSMSYGLIFSTLFICASALFALPPLWRKLSETSFDLSLAARFSAGIISFLIGISLFSLSTVQELEKPEESQKQGNNEATTNTANASNTDTSLDKIEAKVAKHAVIVMSRSEYPKLYRKLGKRTFDKANKLSKWAALVVASNSKCDLVDLVEVSDKSARDNIEWFVDCTNGERFQITEADAEKTKKQITAPKPDPIEIEKKPAPKIIEPSTVQSNNSAVDNLGTADEAVIVGSCDRAIKAVYGAYDPSWSYKYRKHATKGRVSVTRDFEASGAFGKTLPHRYECLVDASTRDLVSLRVRHPTGWRTLFSR